jgi:hypothetical protein
MKLPRFSLIFILVCGSSGLGPGVAAQPFPLDAAELQVNVYTTNMQRPLGVARWGDGDFVVAWWSENDPGGLGDETIEVRRFDSSGRPLGDQFQINTVTSRVWYGGSISADLQGNFVVVWESLGSVGSDLDWSIQARRYRSNGYPLDPAEFQVNTYTVSAQVRPRVAHDAAGNFVVVWYGVGDGSWTGIWGRRFRADGTPLDASDFVVNSYSYFYQWDPVVAAAPAGEFVVAWTSYYGAGTDPFYSIQARRFGADGTPLDASEFQVNTYTTSYQEHPAVAIAPNGDFIVAWDSLRSGGSDPSDSIQARRFRWNGTPRDASDHQVNVFTTGSQRWPRVATNAEGDYVVVWHSQFSQDGDPFYSGQMRRYREDGTEVDVREFQVNTYTTGFQDFPMVAAVPEGDFVVSWESDGSAGSDTDSTSIQARRFGRPAISITSIPGDAFEPGCDLRDAITAANTNVQVGDCPAGNEGAVIELPAGSAIALAEADNGANGLPVIQRPVKIRGHGARIERDPGLACPAGPEFRLFEVADGGILTLEDVAVSNGCLSSGPGAGVFSDSGSLVLREASIEGNEAVGGAGGGVAAVGGNLLAFDSSVRGNLAGEEGGGISVAGSPGWLLIERATVSENVAASGGGLTVAGSTFALVRNSTFSGNVAASSGGALELTGPSAALVLDFSTVTGNSAPAGAGANVAAGGLFLHGSLLGENLLGADCAGGAGSVAASGLNLDTDGSCAALAGGSFLTVPSLGLGPLADNGGWGRTHLPLSGSPALDAAPACVLRSGAPLALDGRGYPRPSDDDGDLAPECELGAVERGPIFLDGFDTADPRRWSGAVP